MANKSLRGLSLHAACIKGEKGARHITKINCATECAPHLSFTETQSVHSVSFLAIYVPLLYSKK